MPRRLRGKKEVTILEYGLIGERLSHSHSPRIHGLLADYDYQLREISPEDLPSFLEARDFRGLNVTIPYKKTVLPWCDALGEGARRIGCVNTLVRRADGSLFGDNTDYYGFCTTLRRGGVDPKGRRCLVLGSGGTSLTASKALEDLGAASVDRVSRSGSLSYDNVYDRADAEIIVNTTPVGMFPNNGNAALDLSRFPNLKGVADVVYNPLKTAFLLQAEALGAPHAGGLPMLVAQAKRAAELFTGETISEEKMEAVLRKVQADVTNLILIGMPGSGKSTLGRLAAKQLGRPFLDADCLIAEKAGMSIPEIFEKEGEAGFRLRETEVLAELGKRSGVVIATGGGAVLRKENLPLLRQNGWICRLRRPVEELPLSGRPLSSSPQRLREMEVEREPYYAAAADWTLFNSGKPEELSERMIHAFLGE